MIGETISHYRIVDKLGGGGMGVIYEAEDTRLGRRVALKFIPDNLAGDSNALERFEREARAASQLAHPNICTIHDIEDNNGHPFLVMEKLEGESLKQRIHRQPIELKELLDIGVQVASALEASHAKLIIHRDIKPGNIFLTTNGPVKVLDFGLAKLPRNHALATSEDTPTDDSLTAADVVPGTAIYMSPEQARSEPLDPRSDLFSFGVVLYEMATGKKPFHGKNTVTTLSAVLRDKPKSPAELNPKIPPELVGIIGKAMQKNRRYRYQDAAAIKADLQRLQKRVEGGTPVASRQLRLSTDAFQGSHRRLAILLLIVSALLLTVLGSGAIWWMRHRQPPPPVNSIAVLPLTNINHDSSLDNLRFALADAMSNSLTDVPALSVRPSSETQRYADKEVDPRKAGRELHAAVVVSGHFLGQGERLMITLEAVKVETNTVIWQTTVQSITDNPALTRAQVVAQMRQGLLPALGLTTSKKK